MVVIAVGGGVGGDRKPGSGGGGSDRLVRKQDLRL